jgi:hypothetical protein
MILGKPASAHWAVPLPSPGEVEPIRIGGGQNDDPRNRGLALSYLVTGSEEAWRPATSSIRRNTAEKSSSSPRVNSSELT